MRVLTAAQEEYQRYLHSPHWKRMRELVLERAKDCCERCGRFAGKDPHGLHLNRELECCRNPLCEFCAFYFDADGRRNDCELQILEVHHLTYARRGHEHLSDLRALCWGCHEDTWDEDR